jgi:hypothetical protein
MMGRRAFGTQGLEEILPVMIASAKQMWYTTEIGLINIAQLYTGNVSYDHRKLRRCESAIWKKEKGPISLFKDR